MAEPRYWRRRVCAGHSPWREGIPTDETGAAGWLRASLTTFAEGVASFLPGHFDAYARIYHPFDNDDGSPDAARTWRELTARAGGELRDPAAAEDFARSGVPTARASAGSRRYRFVQSNGARTP